MHRPRLYLVENETIPQNRRGNPCSRVEAKNRLMTSVPAKVSYIVKKGTVRVVPWVKMDQHKVRLG